MAWGVLPGNWGPSWLSDGPGRRTRRRTQVENVLGDLCLDDAARQTTKPPKMLQLLLM